MVILQADVFKAHFRNGNSLVFLDIENFDGCHKIYECKYKLFAALMESFSPLSLSPCIRAGVHRNAEYFA